MPLERAGGQAQFITHRHRIRRAQQLLEETDAPVEKIGALVGFASPTAFRECFRGVVGVGPRAYRAAFPA